MKQLLESVGVRTLTTFAIVSPCAAMRDLAVPWNCCGSTGNKKCQLGLFNRHSLYFLRPMERNEGQLSVRE